MGAILGQYTCFADDGTFSHPPLGDPRVQRPLALPELRPGVDARDHQNDRDGGDEWGAAFHGNVRIKGWGLKI